MMIPDRARDRDWEGTLATAVFIAAYATIATVVGMAYFVRRRWDLFFDTHAIGGEAREVLLLHLMLGAAAIGAAWPVGVVFGAYVAVAGRSRPVGHDQGPPKGAPAL
jgi:hypothetical protein